MVRSAERNSLLREGVLPSSTWVMGSPGQGAALGLLVQDWKPDSGV